MPDVRSDVKATEATLRALLQMSARDAEAVASAIAASRKTGDYEAVLDIAGDLIEAEGTDSDGRISFLMCPPGTRTLYCVLETGDFLIGEVS